MGLWQYFLNTTKPTPRPRRFPLGPAASKFQQRQHIPNTTKPTPSAGLRMSVNEADYLCVAAVGICWREESGKDMEWVWLCGRCSAPPTQEMKLAVVWAVLYSDLHDCVCSVGIWVLCVNSGMGCELPMAKQHLSQRHRVIHMWALSGPSIQAYWRTLRFRSHTS